MPHKKNILLLLACFLYAGGALAAAEAIEIRVPGQNAGKKFTVSALKAKLKPVTVTIQDPVYKKQKSYEGFPLLDVLKLAGLDVPGTAKAEGEIVFTSLDGYAPNTSLRSLEKYKAVLVYKESGKRGLDKIPQGKALVPAGPFYVIWEEGETLGEKVPWPYQLAKIEIVDFRETYAKLYPTGSNSESGAQKGFLVFKDRCLRCHSVNLQGGDLGPELNVPQNITEYWEQDTLKKFIKNAWSFRLKSKMPPFLDLKDEEIDHIVEYLAHMKGLKATP